MLVKGATYVPRKGFLQYICGTCVPHDGTMCCLKCPASHGMYTWLSLALFSCNIWCYDLSVLNGLECFIYLHSSGLFSWHWGNKECPTPRDVTLKDMDKINHYSTTPKYNRAQSHAPWYLILGKYHKISNIRYTKSPNLNYSHFILQLSLLDPLKRGVKSRMKM